MTSRANFLATLQLNDPFTRLVYADWCEQEGLGDLALTQRWLVAEKVRLQRSLVDHSYYWLDLPLDVQCALNRRPRLPVGRRYLYGHQYETIAEAEDVLTAVLVALAFPTTPLRG